MGADDHVHELWWDSNGWHDNDLTAAGGAPKKPAGSGPASYVFDAQGTQHVDYLGDDGDVYELWWDTNGWHSNDLTTAAGAQPTVFPSVLSGPRLVSYVFDAQGTQHVDYVGADNDVHELWWDSHGWHPNNLTTAAPGAAAVGPNSSLSAYVFASQGTQHIDYIASDGHVHELWWDTNGWHDNDLTKAANASVVAGEGAVLTSYVFASQGTQHVDYIASDGHVHELWWDTNGWHDNDLTVAAGAPANTLPNEFAAPTGYVFAAQSTQHVIYIGGDSNLYELWWG